MASIGKDKNGYRRILFVAPDGKRKTIRLGKATTKQAEAVKVRIERLVGALHSGDLDPETVQWVAKLDDKLHARLAAVGLSKPRNRTGAALGAFLTEFFGNLPVKDSTRTAYLHTKRVLVEYFGETKPLREIESADADRWRTWMQEQGLAQATIARRVKVARQAFKRAVRWGLILQNPFAEVRAGTMTNPDRQYFITRPEAQAVLEACPDAQWRLLFALSRYGGLRCPTEHLALKWTDIDWERGRIRVSSCKTEHLEGKDCRTMPLFPELRPYLLEVFEQAPEGSEYVITRYRDTNQNLRTQLQRIIRRAGLEPWPRLFQNLRSSRETELVERYPIHVVCAWLGNSAAVAKAHYLQVNDAHFAAALQEPEQRGTESGTVRGDNADSGRYASVSEKSQSLELPGDTDRYLKVPIGGMGPEGLEHPAKTPVKTHVQNESGTNSGTPCADLAPETPADGNPHMDRLSALVAELTKLNPAERRRLEGLLGGTPAQ